MGERQTNGVRPRRKTVAAAVIAVLFAMVVSVVALALLGGAGAARGTQPATASADLTPAALANTTIDLNLSETGVPAYLAEYVTLNNASTLHKLPASLTVTAGACDWVSIANTTQPASPVSVFHNVQFHNRTTGNDTGTIAKGGGATGFEVCGGTGVWLNYQYWSYSIYQFSAPTLKAAGTLKATFGDWPGMSTGPAAVSATFDSTHSVSLTVSTNLTFTVVLPSTANGSKTCDYTGQTCSYTEYKLVSAADSKNTTASATISFTAASGLRVTAAYENWTAGYSTSKVSANTEIGGFFSSVSSGFQSYFVYYWYAWTFGLLFVAVVVLAVHRSGRHEHRRRRG